MNPRAVQNGKKGYFKHFCQSYSFLNTTFKVIFKTSDFDK